MSDSSEYWFFVSYAWANNVEQDGAGTLVSKFFGLMDDALRVKVDTSFANGFLDRRRIEPGLNWEDLLTNALRSARSFVPLLTASYFTRESCAKEWSAFEQRASQHPRGRELVVPVVWDRPVRIKPPPGLQLTLDEAGVRQSDAPMVREYNRFGMSTLIDRMATDATAATTVKVVVDALTELIVTRYAEVLLPPARAADVPHWNDLSTTFPHVRAAQAAAGPAQPRLHFAVAAATHPEIGDRRPNADRFYQGTRSDWVPYDQAGINISQVVLETSRRFNLGYNWLQVGDSLVDDIRKLEQQGCAPVIVVVDPWSLDVKALQEPLAIYDRNRFSNCVVVVVWNEEGQKDPTQTRERLQVAVRSVFSRSLPLAGATTWFNTNVRDVDSLRAALLQAVQDIRALSAPQQPAQRPVQSGDAPPLVRNQ